MMCRLVLVRLKPSLRLLIQALQFSLSRGSNARIGTQDVVWQGLSEEANKIRNKGSHGVLCIYTDVCLSIFKGAKGIARTSNISCTMLWYLIT